jgi:hypothetical protein
MRARHVLLAAVAACGGGGGGPDGPLAFTSTVRGAPTNISFVAFRDDGGAWQPLAGTGGVYPFTPSGERYELVWVCSTSFGSSVTTLDLLQATVAEVPEPSGACVGRGPTDVPHFTLSGTITGADIGTTRSLIQSSFDASASQGSLLGFQPVPQGSYDLYVRNENQGTYRVVLRRDILLDRDRTLDIAFGAESFETDAQPLTVAGAATGEGIAAASELRTHTRGLQLSFPSDETTWRAIPAAFLEPGDLQSVIAVGADRSARRYGHASEPVTLTLRENRVAASSSVQMSAAAPYPRLSATFTPDPDATVHMFWWSSPLPVPNRTWRITMTPGWIGDATTVTIDTPALSGVTGWNDAWAAATGPARWNVDAHVRSDGVAGFVANDVFEGLETTISSAEGELAF